MPTILYIDETGAFGGAITCMAHLIRHLDHSRFQPVIILHHQDPILADRVGGVPTHVLRRKPIGSGPVGRRLQSALETLLGRQGARVFALGRTFLGFWLDILPRSRAIRRIAREHSVALIHTNNSLELNLAGILAARSLAIPCVAHIRNFEAVRRTQRWIFRRVSHCLVQSCAQKEQLARDGLDPGRITVVHETVADDEILPFEDRPPAGDRPSTYGITGMLVPWKGHRTFLQAAALIRDRVPGARGVIIGDETPMNPGYAKELRAYASELGLDQAVEFRGLVKDMRRALRDLDVFVHASDSPEPFGRVIIEAMAAGIPVVAADAGGPREIVAPGETGLLFTPRNPEALADAISALLENHPLCLRMARAGYDRILRHFRASQQAGSVTAIYDQLLGATKACSPDAATPPSP